MNRAIGSLTLVAAILFCYLVTSAYADYVVTHRGTWPGSWPGELDPLRERSRTLVGGELNVVFYEIPFTRREDLEAAWPHLLKVGSKDAPLILSRGPDKRLGLTLAAGVRIKCPPAGGGGRAGGRQDWDRTVIELVVDGSVADLNRLPLPAGTPIVDERFNDGRR